MFNTQSKAKYFYISALLLTLAMYQNCSEVEFKSEQHHEKLTSVKKCSNQFIPCEDDKGSGQKSCENSEDGPRLGQCLYDKCNAPYILTNDKNCVTVCSSPGEERPCLNVNIENGTGKEICNEKLQWGLCQIECDDKFYLNQSTNKCEAAEIQISANGMKSLIDIKQSMKEPLKIEISYTEGILFDKTSESFIKVTSGSCKYLTEEEYRLNESVPWRKNNISTDNNSENLFSGYIKGTTPKSHNWLVPEGLFGCSWQLETIAETKTGAKISGVLFVDSHVEQPIQSTPKPSLSPKPSIIPKPPTKKEQVLTWNIPLEMEAGSLIELQVTSSSKQPVTFKTISKNICNITTLNKDDDTTVKHSYFLVAKSPGSCIVTATAEETVEFNSKVEQKTIMVVSPKPNADLTIFTERNFDNVRSTDREVHLGLLTTPGGFEIGLYAQVDTNSICKVEKVKFPPTKRVCGVNGVTTHCTVPGLIVIPIKPGNCKFTVYHDGTPIYKKARLKMEINILEPAN